MSHVLLAAYRIRFPFIYAATVALIAVAIATFIPMNDSARAVRTAIWGCAMGVLILGISVTMLGGRRLPDRRTVVVTAPVRGRWLALNSPASAVPSHGVRAYGQTYAIDLVAEPLDRDRPEFASGPMMRPAPEYPAFGEPVRAMIDGTVVRASDWRRDHRARSHWSGLLYLTAEGAIRELGGPGFVVGNHVVIRGHGESRQVFAVVAHLQRGSVTVRVGDTVRAGDKIGRCGNSGNSTEPHVHAQLMDRASAWTGQGIPLEFSDINVGESEERITGMPQNEQHMTSEFSGSSAGEPSVQPGPQTAYAKGMPTRYEAAIRLDIPIDMAKRHGIPSQLSAGELEELDTNPPAWLAQSRANRTGKRAVWATLTCALCGFEERSRPKKWWPEFTVLACDEHDASELPEPAAGAERSYCYGVGSRFFGAVDTVPPTDELDPDAPQLRPAE